MKQRTYEIHNGIKLTHVCGEISPDFWEELPHSHDHCEIFVHIFGKLDIFVEENLYRLSGGEIRIYRSNELHCGKTDSTQYMEWYQISVPKEFFEASENKALGQVLYNRKSGTGNVFIPERYGEIVNLLGEATSTEGELTAHYCYSAVLMLLCIINEKNGISISDSKNTALGKITDAVNNNFSLISTVEELGKITHYSTSYITKIFKSELNITPYKFIIGKKLNEAKNVLQKGMSVTEACEYSGFNDYANFITLFRKHFGVTPKQWAKSYTLRRD